MTGQGFKLNSVGPGGTPGAVDPAPGVRTLSSLGEKKPPGQEIPIEEFIMKKKSRNQNRADRRRLKRLADQQDYEAMDDAGIYNDIVL